MRVKMYGRKRFEVQNKKYKSSLPTGGTWRRVFKIGGFQNRDSMKGQHLGSNPLFV